MKLAPKSKTNQGHGNFLLMEDEVLLGMVKLQSSTSTRTLLAELNPSQENQSIPPYARPVKTISRKVLCELTNDKAQ